MVMPTLVRNSVNGAHATTIATRSGCVSIRKAMPGSSPE
jgi:hypothetical protein